jgi:hypothetical protein
MSDDFKIISSIPDGYPTVDFYGDPITANAYAGAVQRPLVSPITWKANASDNHWDVAANWVETLIPEVYTSVIIPASTTYPELETGKTYACKDISFKAGAELGRQNLLTDYTTISAQIEYKLDPVHRFNMLAIPVGEITADQFYLGGSPKVYLKEYYVTDGEKLAAWKNITNFNQPLSLGSGFAYRVGNELGNGLVSVTISGTGLADGFISETLQFGSDSKYGSSRFALAANPFMTSINFATLANQESSPPITPNYLIWNDQKAYTGYTPNGIWGNLDAATNPTDITTATGYGIIAPLQSFIVEEISVGNTNDQLSFNLADISATGQGQLRSTTPLSDKLSFVASNENASILTFIANREYGQATVSNRDARKLFSSLSNIPDIYTLKESENGQVALGANIIDSNNTLIPLGLLTNYNGNIKFTFQGMDSYNAAITFIDMVENKQIDLTGLTAYEYSFDYTPVLENGQAIAENNRFFIQLAPATPTGVSKIISTNPVVYSKNRVIYAVSAPSDIIRQVWIYNVQGKLVYADKHVNTSSCTIPYGTAIPEVCIVKLITGEGVKNVKLITK